MEVPKRIRDVLTEKEGFDRLFNDNLDESITKKEAYDKTIDQIAHYYPLLKPRCSSYQSYYVTTLAEHRRRRRNNLIFVGSLK